MECWTRKTSRSTRALSHQDPFLMRHGSQPTANRPPHLVASYDTQGGAEDVFYPDVPTGHSNDVMMTSFYVWWVFVDVMLAEYLIRLGYCFSPYQRLWLYNGAPLVAFYDTLGIRRTYSRLEPRRPHGGGVFEVI